MAIQEMYLAGLSQPIEAVATLTGREMLEHNKGLQFRLSHPRLCLAFLAQEYDTSLIERFRLGINGQRLRVAVKYLKDGEYETDYPEDYISGFEQYQALQDLQRHGILVAKPLIATKNTLVTEWVEGKPMRDFNKWNPRDNNSLTEEYFRFLGRLGEACRQLKNDGIWPQNWEIDQKPQNYIITPNGFVAVDPVTIYH